jgi:cell division septation protein DedD
VVQIAAVSHQEDANLLVSTLKRRGYAVVVRNDPRDKLLHVQVGPFATRQDAEAMRQRLAGDGFNAIVKEPNR